MDELDKPKAPPEKINKELLLEVLGNLSKLRKDFPYTLLLQFLTVNQAMDFLDIFSGCTVTFPTAAELMECVTFSVVKKYGDYEKIPPEVLNGLTKKRYRELLQSFNKPN